MVTSLNFAAIFVILEWQPRLALYAAILCNLRTVASTVVPRKVIPYASLKKEAKECIETLLIFVGRHLV